MQAFITQALEKGLQPKKAASDALIIRDGTRYATLVDVGGKLTQAGRFYQESAGRQLPTGGYDAAQTPVRTGNVESIKMRGGVERVVRTYDPITNNFKYTQLGKRFFAQRRVEYVVRVPATFSGTRANGQAYQRRGFFPVENNVTLPQI